MSTHLKEKWLLFQLKQKKDPEIFGQLYDLYAPRLYRFVYFKVSGAEDAEDVTADIFLKAWQYVNERKEIESFSGLLYTIARTTIIDFYRQKSSKETVKDEEMLLQIADTENAAERLAESEEIKNMLDAVKCLKEEYREVLTLRYVDELEISEVANILDKSPLNVRVITHRALKALKNVIEKQHVKKESHRTT